MSAPFTDADALEIADILERTVAEIRARVRTSAIRLADLPDRSADDDVLLDPTALAAVLRIDVRTLRRLRAAGEIPEPISLGARRPRWRKHVIDAWLRERSAS